MLLGLTGIRQLVTNAATRIPPVLPSGLLEEQEGAGRGPTPSLQEHVLST